MSLEEALFPSLRLVQGTTVLEPSCRMESKFQPQLYYVIIN